MINNKQNVVEEIPQKPVETLLDRASSADSYGFFKFAINGCCLQSAIILLWVHPNLLGGDLPALRIVMKNTSADG